MSDRMTHDERVHYHTYTTCETPAEHAERIVKLEELAYCLFGELRFLADNPELAGVYAWPYNLEEEAKELGVEVDE